MKNWITRVALMGLAVLPATAHAQYPAGYYVRPMPAYAAPYGYGYPYPTGYYQPAYNPYGYYAQALATPSATPSPTQSAPSQPVASLPAAGSLNATPVNGVRPADESTASPASSPVKAQYTPPPPPAPVSTAADPVRSADTTPTQSAPGVAKGATLPAPATDVKPVSQAVESFCPADKKNCCISVFAEGLYWTAHGVDVPYAQAYDGINPATSSSRGPVGVDSPRYELGVRGGAGVSIDDTSWVVATFTYLRTGNSNSISAPNGDVLHNYLTFPNTVSAAPDSLTASADYHIELLTVDVDYKCAFINTEHLVMNWIAGVRYGHLDETLDATYQITGTTNVDSHVTFDGGGPRFGIEGKYAVCHGFYGYGSGVLNLLFGQFDASIDQHNVFAGLQGQTSIIESRFVPIPEIELGAGWQSCDGRFRVSAGYYVGIWGNTLTMPSLSQGTQNTNFTTNGNNFRDTLIFDGFVGRVEFRF